MPPATDKADPWGQFLNTFMFFTEGKSHLFLLLAIYYIYTCRNNTFIPNNKAYKVSLALFISWLSFDRTTRLLTYRF